MIAFLYEIVNKEIYVELSTRYKQGIKVYYLIKALYGLK